MQITTNKAVKYRRKWLTQFNGAKKQMHGKTTEQIGESFYSRRNWFKTPTDITLFKVQWDNGTTSTEYACNLQIVR